MLFLPIHTAVVKGQGVNDDKSEQKKRLVSMLDMPLDDVIQRRKDDRKRKIEQQRQQQQQQESYKKMKISTNEKKTTKTPNNSNNNKHKGREHHQLPPQRPLIAALIAAPNDVTVVIQVTKYLGGHLTEHLGTNPRGGLYNKISQVEEYLGQPLAKELRDLNIIRNKLVHGLSDDFERFNLTREQYVDMFENVLRGLDQIVKTRKRRRRRQRQAAAVKRSTFSSRRRHRRR